tara:strand:- start:776 stop:1030 length:255 start_codon:yes stop_codon:yes gene_type:complete
MADGLSGVGSAPFNIASDIHQQSRQREAIENHLSEQRVEKEHRANHKHLEELYKQRLDLQQSYDRFGSKTIQKNAVGTNVNIEV